MVEKIAGRSVVRTDAADKVNGRALYLDDIKWDAEVLYGACVRADVAPGRLIGVVPDADYNWSGITVAYPGDIPGQNIIKVYMRYEDMPLLADRQVLYRGEPVLLVAADSPERAQEAAKHFTVEVESMEGVRDLEDIVARFKAGGEGLSEFDAQTIVKGDAAQALASAPVVVEGEYWTGCAPRRNCEAISSWR
ncbi:MAG: hypothetical protein EOL87_13585 [Spartobacteria bacterium]|nr:hypothetical protein [Spartobacteria bacterium]